MITVLWREPDDDDWLWESREWECWCHEIDDFVSTLLIEGDMVRMITEDEDDV